MNKPNHFNNHLEPILYFIIASLERRIEEDPLDFFSIQLLEHIRELQSKSIDELSNIELNDLIESLFGKDETLYRSITHNISHLLRTI